MSTLTWCATVLFGRPWRFPYGYLENPEFLHQHHSAGFHGLALPKLPAIGSSLFAPDYGLFVFSPILALGAVCAWIVVVLSTPAGRGLANSSEMNSARSRAISKIALNM